MAELEKEASQKPQEQLAEKENKPVVPAQVEAQRRILRKEVDFINSSEDPVLNKGLRDSFQSIDKQKTN